MRGREKTSDNLRSRGPVWKAYFFIIPFFCGCVKSYRAVSEKNYILLERIDRFWEKSYDITRKRQVPIVRYLFDINGVFLVSFIHKLLILVVLSFALTAWLAVMLFEVSLMRAFIFVGGCMAVGLLKFVQLRIRAWSENDDSALRFFYMISFRTLVGLDALILVAAFWIHPIISFLFVGLASYYARQEADNYKNSRNNMMITVQRPEGDFQSIWVHRNKDSEIWCVSYDKDNHGILLRRVTENKKGSEGYVTLESGAKSAKLFEWDGNKSILDSGDKRGEYSYQSPEYDVPVNASVMGEVKF